MDIFRAHVQAVLGPRVRATSDAEGWPQAVGRYGRLEWRGAEPSGEHRLFAYTDRRLIIGRLRRLPGVHPWQAGNAEAASWVAADDAEALREVAGLLRLRKRRAAGLPVPAGRPFTRR
jgi:hypothetical protein